VPPDDGAAPRAAELAARRSYGKLVAFLAARTRDVAGAEDALSEAFTAALADWPVRGVPANPEAWLLTVARRRQIDAVRTRIHDEGASQYFALLEELAEPPDDSGIPDERLRLLFACAHPAIADNVRSPLMLQAVLGLDAAAIASAFLVAPAAMGQRLVRAKAKIRQAGIPFEVPARAAWAERLDAVLAAIYAAFSEGWSDAEGADPARRNLTEEAIWLGRVLAGLLPEEPEVLGLLALMLHAQARRRARRDAAGGYVPLAGQDVTLWDLPQLEEAEALLRTAAARRSPGRFQLEAAVQSAHAVRRHGQPVDWAAVVQLYEALQALTGSPVAGLNRAVALARLRGPAAGLDALAALAGEARLAEYQPWWAAQAHLLAQAGRTAEAEAAYDRAIGLARDDAVRGFLQRRRAALRGGGTMAA
jgi:RNA polymerase sigma-70 factor (ECF subfamily)